MTKLRRMLWVVGAPARLVLVALIQVYRATLSHAFGGQCRFHPTCSQYALDVVRTHGAARGLALSVWRVLRCSPLTAGGIDPAPPRGEWASGFRRDVRQRHTREEAA